MACPDNTNCQEASGILLPAPNEHYWLSTSSAKDFKANLDLYRCPRLTCKGSDPDDYQECWTASNISRCSARKLLCVTGAKGPLCGSCVQGFVYSSSQRTCIECGESWIFAGSLLGAGLAVGCFVLGLYMGRLTLPAFLENSVFAAILRDVDSGTFRVVFNAYQLIQSVAWNLDVVFPR